MIKMPCVLVVDDNAANVLVLSSMLRRMDIQVDEANSGMEAINHACEKEYDVIFMDHLMPEMDGIQTIKQILFIAKGEKRPFVIGVSATIDEEVVKEFMDAGAHSVMEKPVTLEKLREKLQEIGLNKIEFSTQEETQNHEVTEFLDKVKGLNYEKGIDLMAGSVANYMKVLAVCVSNIKDNIEGLQAEKETGSLERLALRFHSLKGIFLNIGAEELAQTSKEYEMAAKRGDSDKVYQALEQYIEKLETINGQMKDAYTSYEDANRKESITEAVSPSEFISDLRKLKEHIEDFEYIEITELLEKMLASSQGKEKEALEVVEEAIREFDYDKALEETNRLETEMSL